MTGTITLSTDRLLLRRYHIEDAQLLHKLFGIDEKMFEYSGWNPYETIEMAQETIQGFIDSYADEHCYSWAIDYQEQLVGTIGAYDYDPNTKSIEIGCSIAKGWWGHGFASEAIREVLRYLLEKEKIRYIKAWSASDNVGSIRAMEHAGMVLVRSEKDALTINGKSYDKLHYGICYSSMVKRVERIKIYEQILDRVNCIMDQSPDVIEGFESIRTDIQKLEKHEQRKTREEGR